METTKMQKIASRPTIQSLERGLVLLRYVVSANEPIRLGELSVFLGIEKSSAHRLMATLIRQGYIVQDNQKQYLSGPMIIELASRIGNRLKVHDAAIPLLQQLAEETGETAHLGILSGSEAIMTHCVSSNHVLAVTSRIGDKEPLYCTALGKALICEMKPEKIKTLLGSVRWKKYTGHTITSLGKYLRECEQIRADGFAKDNEEYRLGVRCLAAPVRDFSGQIIAGIGISGPISRLHDKYFFQASQTVKKIGIEL